VATHLLTRHIPTSSDVFQNIGKNSMSLVRGNEPEFDSLLEWGAAATLDQVTAALDLAAAALAAKSRPVLPLPSLRQSKLTFAATMGLFDALLATPSEGVHEQFVFASALHALVAQTGQVGLRVTTKPINASDQSSGTAGDVQVKMGDRWLRPTRLLRTRGRQNWRRRRRRYGRTTSHAFTSSLGFPHLSEASRSQPLWEFPSTSRCWTCENSATDRASERVRSPLGFCRSH